MRLINLTAGNEIGANSYFLEMDGVRVIIDSGLHPKLDGYAALPRHKAVIDEEVDAICLSHCHLDHVGSLPVTMRRFERAPVYMTPGSYPLADVVLHNSCNIMKMERDEKGISEYPLFTHREVDRLRSRWEVCPYDQPETLRRKGESVSMSFHDAGHILGSAGIRLEGRNESFFYTGDVNFNPQTLMMQAEFPQESVNVMMVETTRGMTEVPAGMTRKKVEERFAQRLNEILISGGSVLLPCFALGKQQEMLALLHEMMTEGRIPHSPIYFGGLGRQMTEIYDLMCPSTRRLKPDLKLLSGTGAQVLERGAGGTMPLSGGKIFAVSAGMLVENTPAFALAQRFLNQPQHAIFFVGYVDPDTPGGLIKAAGMGQKVKLSPELPETKIQCQVDSFDFSAHANREDLMSYILKLRPKVTVLVHGDAPAMEWFSNRLKKNGLECVIPESQKMYQF